MLECREAIDLNVKPVVALDAMAAGVSSALRENRQRAYEDFAAVAGGEHHRQAVGGEHRTGFARRLAPAGIGSGADTGKCLHGHTGMHLFQPDRLATQHIAQMLAIAGHRSRIIADRISTGRLAIVGLTYQLSEGQVNVQGVYGDIGERPAPTAVAAESA